MKLTKTMIDATVSRVIKDTIQKQFTQALEAREAKGDVLLKRILKFDGMTDIAAMPKHYFSQNNYFSIYVGNQFEEGLFNLEDKPNVDGDRKSRVYCPFAQMWSSSCYTAWHIIGHQDKGWLEYDAADKEVNRLDREMSSALSRLKAMFSGYSTVEKFKKALPELEKYLPDEVREEPLKMMVCQAESVMNFVKELGYEPDETKPS